jgi:hypothetical protein
LLKDIVLNKKSREKFVKIDLSMPTLMRTRCKFCREIPSIHFVMSAANYYKNVRDFIKLSSWIEKNKEFVYFFPTMLYAPNVVLISDFSFNTKYKSYKPSMHHNKSKDNKSSDRTRGVVNCLTCNCGQTYWIFNQQYGTNRIDIFSRKSGKKYPNKIKND